MKLERSKNAARNIFWGMVNKISVIVAQFVLRIVLLKTLGEAYLGLNSLFTSVLSVLSLAELGMGSALVFHMYRAIVDDDGVKICALLQFYKKCYHTVAWVILVLGLAVMPFLPFLVRSDLPDGMNLYVLYALNLACTVISYSLFAYKGCLLEAHQRTDILSKIAVLLTTLQYAVQIILLFVCQNYYLYSVVTPIIFLCSNLLTSFAADRLYPAYRAKGRMEDGLKRSIFAKVRALFFYKAGAVVSASLDNIVVSACLGLVVLGKFSNYYYVISMLFAFLLMYYNAITAGLGNSVATESAEKNFKNFKKLLFLQSWICGFCAVCLSCLLQDFIALWMGEELLFGDRGIVVCFASYFYVWRVQDVVGMFKDAAGMWEKDRFRPLVSAAVNLLLNLVLVRFIGVYGVLLSTVACNLFIDLPWSPYALFKNYFQTSRTHYYLRLALYTAINVAVAGLTFLVCSLLPVGGVLWQRILWFILKMLVCAVFSNLLYLLIYHRTGEFRELRQTVKNIIRSK